MKKTLLTLSLITTSGLFAWKKEPQENSESELEKCTHSRCCSQHCLPKPMECTNCECYTPPYYDLRCNCGFFVTGEFLYWYAYETNLPIAAITETVLAFPPTSATPEPRKATVIKRFKYLDTEWSPGYRVGIGWNPYRDGWDYYINYTYYRNTSSGSIAFPNTLAPVPDVGGKALLNPWVQTVLSGFLYYDHMSAKWKLTLNSIDGEIGRKYWLSPCFNLRPYAGIRASWLKTRFNVKASLGPSDSISNTKVTNVIENNTNTFRRNFWGVGFLGGFQPTWHFAHCFALYANADIALLWGESNGGKSEFYSGSIQVSGVTAQNSLATNKYTDNYNRMQPILDLGIGLHFETTWRCDRYRTFLDFGWEHHIWFDQYKMTYEQLNFVVPKSAPVVFIDSLKNVNSEIGFGGLVIRAGFSF